MFGLNTQELLIIFLIILLLFGSSRIPEIGRALGRGIRDFKRATRDLDDEVEGRESSRKITKEREEPRPENSTRS